MGSYSRCQLVDYISKVNLFGNVLDVGCGPEKYWARNWTQGKPAVYHTIDIQEEFKPTYVLDLNEDLTSDVAWTAQPQKKHYDVILSFETFEHLWNPVQAVLNVREWLKEGGKFYFSAPFINPIHDTHDMCRLTDEWWYAVLEKHGFRKISVVPRTATHGVGLLQAFFKTEGLRMSKIRLKDGQAHKLNHIGYMGVAEI